MEHAGILPAVCSSTNQSARDAIAGVVPVVTIDGMNGGRPMSREEAKALRNARGRGRDGSCGCAIG